MSDEGYIKLHRSLLKWEWIENPNVLAVFIHCLLKANFQDKKWQGLLIERGCFVTSINKLSLETGLSIQQVRTILKKLNESGELLTKSQQGTKHTIIRVCNYDKFQEQQCNNNEITNNQQRDNNEITNNQQTTNKELTTTKNVNNNKNVKNDKNVKNEKNNTRAVYYPEDETLDNAFRDYVDMRKKIKAPMTDKAVELAIKKLHKLSAGDNDKAIKILEQSIMNSWKGLFELKESTNKTAQSLNDSYDMMRQWAEGE